MNEDTMKDIIRDAHSLAKAENVTADIVRAGAETIARRLERLVAHGLYITPKAALDVVAGERPLDKMLKTPMSEGVEECGSEGVKKRSWLELPRNITLRRYVGADRGVTLVGQYRSTDPGELGASDSRPLRVYMIRLEHRADTAWNAMVMENDEIIFELQTARGGRSMAEHVAVKALEAWLRYLSHGRGNACAKRHRKALKQRKKAARRAANPSNPSNPN